MRPILTMRFALCLLLTGLTISSAFANTATLVYDPAGNVATRTTTLGTTTYTYDQINRLTAESGPAGNFTYHYDPDGVRLSDSKNTYSTTSNRLATRNGVTVVTDAAGNITNDGRGFTYVYNQANQLAQVLRGATLIATYVYDYRGLRARKVTTAAAPQGAQVVRYVYDEAGHLAGEVSATGAPIRTYIWADDKLYAQIDHTPTDKEIFFEVDHLGTPRAALDQSGRVVWTWESDAFGAIQPNQNPSGLGTQVVNLRFPGQYFDQETGLFYNGMRYYDPTMGQFIQPDPIGLNGGTFSTYTYVNGNPMDGVDPDGLFEIIRPNGQPTSFSDAVTLGKREAMLQQLADVMQQKINKICKNNRSLLQAAFDNWKVYVDPNADDIFKRARTGYAHTWYNTQQTRFNWGFFNTTSSDPGISLIFSHEFRHLMKSNHDLDSSSDFLNSSAPVEQDADAWASKFNSGSCGCE